MRHCAPGPIGALLWLLFLLVPGEWPQRDGFRLRLNFGRPRPTHGHLLANRWPEQAARAARAALAPAQATTGQLPALAAVLAQAEARKNLPSGIYSIRLEQGRADCEFRGEPLALWLLASGRRAARLPQSGLMLHLRIHARIPTDVPAPPNTC